MNSFIQAGDLAGQRQEQSKSVFSDTDSIAAGSAHDQDAATRSFIQIDVVHADAGAANHAQAGSFFEEFGGDFGGAAHDESVSVGDLRVQSFLGG